MFKPCAVGAVLLWSGTANACLVEPIEALEKVGETRLSVWFWDVYDAALYTDSGNYNTYQQRALQLNYLRSISADDLVDTTAEEWEKLNIKLSSEHQQWLAQLRDIWPDVTKGDCLMLVENAAGESVFYNAEGELGSVASAQFTDDFLAIWLSPNSRFREERDALVGEQQ